MEISDADKHGILQAEGTRVKFSDGTFFTPFGTTIYGLAHQTDELIKEIFDTLKAAPLETVDGCYGNSR